jgi:SagB-type dehydrogenase family enzyme
MKNQQVEAAWSYHNRTKHSDESIRTNRHYLDWENQPLPFKIYPTLEPIPLPQRGSSSTMPTLAAIAATAAKAGTEADLTRESLSEILFLSAGITRRRKYPGGEILFRAAACTGALYHIDLYIMCGDLTDLEAGVYQFNPRDFSLQRLRAGDYRSVLVNAGGGESALTKAPCIIVSASTFWRNAWKYQARAYRHCYWDSGTILANLLAAAVSRRAPAKLIMGFIDDTVNRLLGLDSRGEAPLSLVALGESPEQRLEPAPPLAPLSLETLPLSKRFIDYPAMREMHEASSLETAKEVTTWREGKIKRNAASLAHPDQSGHGLFPLQAAKDENMARRDLDEVILRRGSTRRFARTAISFAELSTMLDRATRGIPADFLETSDDTLNEIYLIVNAVEGLPAGAYYFSRAQRTLELLKQGDFRLEAGYLGLGQEIPADCSVNVYFLADLAAILQRFGNRGYRAAQLEAAIMGGKLYLAAYAQRLGASGLTFFDDDVIKFFSPHGEGKSVMFLVALGKSVINA